MIWKVKVFTNRESTALVARVLVVTLHWTLVFIKMVYKPMASFTNVQHVTVLASNDIDYACCSAIILSG